MRFKKGNVPWNKGIPATEETKEKIRNIKLLKAIHREAWLYSMRNKKKQTRFPHRKNPNVVLDITL